jgi:hypothetical protein
MRDKKHSTNKICVGSVVGKSVMEMTTLSAGIDWRITCKCISRDVN